MSRALAIVPCYNEEESVASVINSLRAQKLNLEVVVINDASTDNTANVARKAGAMVIDLPINLGIGGAVQSGYQYALREGFDFAIQIDGDGQHPPSEISNLFPPLVQGQADCVIGSRYCAGERLNANVSSVPRIIGSSIITTCIRSLTSKTITDPTSGFRAVNKNLIRFFANNYPHDFPEPISSLQAIRAGYKIEEIRVSMLPRSTGQSSIGLRKSVTYMIKVLWALILARLYR